MLIGSRFRRIALLGVFLAACGDDPTGPIGNFDVEMQYCDPDNVPVFVAYQDGSGPWQKIVGSTAGGATGFGFNLTQTSGGFLEVLEDGGDYQTSVTYASKAQLTELGTNNCSATLPTKTITASVSGVPVGSYAVLSLGVISYLFDGAVPASPVEFDGVQSGQVDFFASRFIPGEAPTSAVIRRNLNVADGGTLAPINFNGSGTFVPAAAMVTVAGAGPNDKLEVYTDISTPNGDALFWNDVAPSSNATRIWAGLPSSVLLSSDLHGLTVFAGPDDGTGDYRVSVRYVGAVSNQAITLGPTLDLPAMSAVTAGAYPRFRFVGTLPAEYDKGAALEIAPSGAGNTYSIIATNAYLVAAGSGQAYDFVMPDVAGLAGFPSESRLTAGSAMVSASGYGFTSPGIIDPVPALGVQYSSAVRYAVLAVP
jgi:hypothetical protein